MKYGRIMITAPKSGSGKTIITCGLLSFLKDRRYNVRAYKCGPDYIDPMFHRRVIGVPGGNLDTFFSDDAAIRRQIAESDSDCAVIEGVMGIYDGITGASGRGSCYDVARATGTPAVLVIDVKGMGATMISVIKGILSDDSDCLIRGVVLNRISERYFGEISPQIESALQKISEERGRDVILLGGIPDVKDIRLESRHLGLMMPDEIGDLEEQVTAARNLIAENIDTAKLLEIMAQAEDLSEAAGKAGGMREGAGSTGQNDDTDKRPQLTLAVARDEAFCFYYEENLRMLEGCGIRIEEFSPLYGRMLPENADGLLLGGGYPELYAEDLSGNVRMREAVREAIENGMPCLAECGGFMYLLDEMTAADGKTYPMCGAIEGSSQNTGRLGRFGYITVSENAGKDAGAGSGPHGEETDFAREDSLLRGLSIKGHEFHYYDSTNNGDDAVAVKPGTGRSWECMHAGRTILAGYPHLYYPSCPELIGRFISRMAEYRENKGGPEDAQACKHADADDRDMEA